MTKQVKKFRLGRLLADSFRELRSAGAVVMLLALTAGAVVLGSNFRLRVSDDIRISFAFTCVMAAGVLFGPVSCMTAAAASDVIDFLLEKNELRGYSVGILAVKLIVAFFYGVFLYRKYYGNFGLSKKLEDFFPECVVLHLDIAVRGVIARVAAVFIGNVVLNSAVLYGTYYNSRFPFLSRSEWSDFAVWFKPRFDKNVGMLPFELATVFLLMPAVNVIYELAGKAFGRLRESEADKITKN